MANNSKKVLVLGAGCAGLSAAWRLARKGVDVEVYEASPKVGGIAAGTIINGNIFEHGPHVFHSSDPEIMKDIMGIAKEDLIPFERTIKIKFLGNYFNFPLSMFDVFSKLPIRTILSALMSFLFYSIKGVFVKPKEENSETVLMRSYGKVLYELFFKSYIEHVWGMKTSEFSPEFARQRIPKLDILKALDTLHSRLKLFKRKRIDTGHFVEKVEGPLYSTKSGFSGITDKIAQEISRLGGKIHLDSKVKEIIWSKDSKRVESIVYHHEGNDIAQKADAVISTIPINEMAHMLKPVPDGGVVQDADKLKFRALVFVGIVIGRKKVLPSSFMYFRDLSFNRVTDLEYFGLDILPGHGTILVAEISCSTDDQYWRNETLAKETVLEELQKEGLLNKDEVIECYTYRLPYAYPMYKMGYEKSLRNILDFVEKRGNFKTIGRVGGFNYANTHVVMRLGYDTADDIAEILKK